MSNLTISMIFVSMITMLMWLSQISIDKISPESDVHFYNCESASGLNYFSKDGCGGDLVLDDSNDAIQNNIPTGEGSVNPDTGNIFTDTFSSIINWFAEKTHLNYIYSILTAPYTILKAMHLPEELAFILGSFWYGLNLFLIVAFFWGRDA